LTNLIKSKLFKKVTTRNKYCQFLNDLLETPRQLNLLIARKKCMLNNVK